MYGNGAGHELILLCVRLDWRLEKVGVLGQEPVLGARQSREAWTAAMICTLFFLCNTGQFQLPCP